MCAEKELDGGGPPKADGGGPPKADDGGPLTDADLCGVALVGDGSGVTTDEAGVVATLPVAGMLPLLLPLP